MWVFRVPDSVQVSERLRSFPVVKAAGSIGEGSQRIGALGFLGAVVVCVLSLSNCAVALGRKGSGVSN